MFLIDYFSGISVSSKAMFQMVEQYFTKGDGMLEILSIAATYALSVFSLMSCRPTLAKKVWNEYCPAFLLVDPSQMLRMERILSRKSAMDL